MSAPASPGQAMDRAAAAFAAGRVDEALALCAGILRGDPRHFYALHLSGAIALQRARWEEALALATRALEVKPGHREVLANRGAALRRLGRFDEALADYDRVLAAHPDAPDARHNRGVALAALGRHDEAIGEYVRALQAAPGFVEALHNLGTSLAALNRHAEAVNAYSRALALDPAHMRARWHRALSLLALGRWREGFADYEARRALGDPRAATRAAPGPAWTGREDVAGRTVLLLAEQGFGDTLMFVRFARALHERGARVLLAAARELAPLLAPLPWLAAVVTPDAPLPACDFTCALGSLPARLDVTLETLLPQQPPLAAPGARRDKWQALLSGASHPRIGIAWSGGVGDGRADPRIVPLEQWQVLREAPLTFVSLQNRVTPSEAASLDAQPRVLRFEPHIADFADTAALIAELDLVITIDTAVAHLAGAMGRPVWILLPFAADWRWLVGREDSPWYPQARLFRQPRPGDWASVLGSVARELARRFAPATQQTQPGLRAKAEARALLASGRVSEAEALARAHGQAAERDGEWLHLHGAALHLGGRHADAVTALEEAAALSPDDARVRNTLGAARLARGDPDGAMDAFDEALRLDPGDAEARFNRAMLLQRRGDETAALAELGALVSARPDHSAARLEWAIALLRAQRAAEAQAAIAPLLARAGSDPRVLLAAGSARLALGDRENAARLAASAAERAGADDAIRESAADLLAACGRASEAVEHYTAMHTRRPRDAALIAKLAAAANAGGDRTRAIDLWREQVRLDPRAPDAAQNLAVALYESDARDEALQVLERAIADGVDDAQLLDALAVYKASECQWDGLDEIVGRLRADPGGRPAPPGSSLFYEGVTPAEQLRWARRWCDAQWPLQRPRPPRAPGPRLRVGFLSGDFYAHATSWLITPMIEAHDRDRFELVACSYAADASDMGERVRRAFDRVVDVAHLGDAEAARVIRAEGIDVLLDLGGHTKSGRLGVLAHRPAPLQGHFLGYPGTTGARFVDFYVADAQVLPPRLEAGFSELAARMPLCYQPNGRARPPAVDDSRAQHGLPAHGVVFCSFNQPIKITSRVFTRWCELLRGVEGSVLWLLDVDERAKANLRREAARRGVDPARLVFAPRMPVALHVARIRHADIALDPFPCGSHTTASDVIRAGVPLVTVRGDTFASRVASSVLAAAGCGDWIFDDPDRAYEATLALARSQPLRQAARARAAAAIDSPLFDAQGYARAFEELLLRLWQESPRLFAGDGGAGVQ